MRYFEDYDVGQVDRYGRYEVTREEALAFSRKYDAQPFHIDDEAARASPVFGRLAVSGWHTASMAMAMLVSTFDESGASANLGGLGVDELRWLKPVFPGDVLRCESEVLEKTPSRSKPDRGVIKWRTTVLNQNGEPVMRYMPMAMYRRRPA